MVVDVGGDLGVVVSEDTTGTISAGVGSLLSTTCITCPRFK